MHICLRLRHSKNSKMMSSEDDLKQHVTMMMSSEDNLKQHVTIRMSGEDNLRQQATMEYSDCGVTGMICDYNNLVRNEQQWQCKESNDNRRDDMRSRKRRHVCFSGLQCVK
jgi:hypothetical protein